MDRLVMNDLVKWKNKSNRKPLMLLGVRQCGKTYIAKQFGKEYFENVAYFNFEGNKALSSLFDYNLDRTYADVCQDVYEFHVLCQTTVPEALICFFESENYEECIRMAMLTNKDTDTAACIAGSVAAAYYGMPEDIKSRLLDFIPEEFINVVETIQD